MLEMSSSSLTSDPKRARLSTLYHTVSAQSLYTLCDINEFHIYQKTTVYNRYKTCLAFFLSHGLHTAFHYVEKIQIHTIMPKTI